MLLVGMLADSLHRQFGGMSLTVGWPRDFGTGHYLPMGAMFPRHFFPGSSVEHCEYHPLDHEKLLHVNKLFKIGMKFIRQQ